jgi:HlyD family secretion protein
MNQSIASGARPRWRWRIAGASAALALAAVVWMLVRSHAGASTSDKDAAVPPLVTVVVPALSAVTSRVSLTGLISARNDMPIGNEGDTGRISEVRVEAGDRVHKGQILARLNPITAQSQLDSAEASLDEVLANAAVAQSEWARAQQGEDIFSKEENERRRTTALTAQAKVKAARAQVRDARNKLAQTIILAPTDGIVLTRTAEVGQIAVPGSTVLFHLARDAEIEMRGEVAEQEVPRLALGQTATVRLDGVAQNFTGKIWQIGAVIDAGTRQGTVRIVLPPNQNLRPGSFARADIEVGSTTGVLLPQTAVLSDEHGSYVLVVGSDNRLERRGVTVGGARSEGLLVSQGLSGSERVVAIAGAFLRTGETVAIAGKAS